MAAEIPQNGGTQERRATQMPSQAEMLQRLQTSGLYGTIPQVHRFYDSLVGYLDHEIVGAGVGMAWELAAYDTLQAYPAVVKAAVDMAFNEVVDVLVPDLGVASDAKAFRKKIMDELRAKAESEKRPAVEHESTNYDLYIAAKKIGDIVLEQAPKKAGQRGDGIWLEDRRNEGVNAYYNQSESGLFLDFSYGLPHSVWTPWGEWGFRGGASSSGDQQEKLVEGVMKRLEVTEFKPMINNEQGSFGPTYAVHAVDGVSLPDPIIRPRNAYLGYEEAHKAWDAFTKQYKAQKGK